ncbi:L-aspartate oxidase [Modicisalibacter radicis]|uniref:L-aspartate oxidase n=1 Tax=Halomonas sp. EAR18 TaxID=2518972 RepID=UPI00109C89B7|nr:L-aspartate oxidase [Halomonas sp. EAR18]
MTESEHDVLIIGGGVAGLTLALELADRRCVTLLRPTRDEIGASAWAQGGIAAVLAPQDTLEAHVRDTLVAGDGLCDERAVRFTVEHGPAAIAWLIDQGVPFTRDTSTDAPYPYHLTREGGHGTRRIIHAADATGRAVVDTLLARANAHPRIRLIADQQVIELCADRQGCCGALSLDTEGRLQRLRARDTVLATGGASGLYRHTTSPNPACGEGMAMAAALGARLVDLEFQQFHPTCLYDPEGPAFLISEAVRGEGGVLRDTQGRRFMPDYDERGELAPRDIVARAIQAEMQRAGSQYVALDITHLPAKTIEHHFPTIVAHCRTRGIDIRHEPIPVVPAAHYSCGGVATGLDGASDIAHLYAIGEVARTGLHGANRMASNSLLECLVFARSAAEALRHDHDRPLDCECPATSLDEWAPMPPDGEANALLERLRDVMSEHAAIVRSDAGLMTAQDQLKALKRDGDRLNERYRPTVATRRLGHALTVATALVEAALQRRESRGLHYNRDHPPIQT